MRDSCVPVYDITDERYDRDGDDDAREVHSMIQQKSMLVMMVHEGFVCTFVIDKPEVQYMIVMMMHEAQLCHNLAPCMMVTPYATTINHSINVFVFVRVSFFLSFRWT